MALLLLICVPVMALANTSNNTNTTLSLSKTAALVGESVTASGTTEPNAWVPLKVMDAAQSILLFDTTKADTSGNYSINFVVPAGATGTLTVVAGEGSNVAIKSLTVTGVPPVDTEAPTWPSGTLTASNVSRTTLTLSWSGATDNLGVTGYRVYQGTTLLTAAPVTGTSYNVTGLTAGTQYTFTVQAGDAAGNWSTDGPSVTVTTTAASTGGSGPGGPAAPQPVNSTTGKASLSSDAGGTVSLGSDVTIKVPANALTGTDKVDITIQKVTSPQAAPAGFRLLGSVYEFKVNGNESYSFNKPVTLTFTFDPEELKPGETPAIYYYDETQGKWINIGGTVSGNTITVQVDHFTKFAVMVSVKQEEQPSFNDIAGHWAADNINQLVGLGAINGYPDGSFKPENTITRAEFATVLVKAFRLTSQDGKVFADTASHWAKEYIATAAAAGVVNGYDASTFGPDDLITREQMAVMIAKAAKLAPVAVELQFSDSGSISEWAKEAVATVTQHGIMKGYPDNTIKPQGNATRAEAVTVIVNTLN